MFKFHSTHYYESRQVTMALEELRRGGVLGTWSVADWGGKGFMLFWEELPEEKKTNGPVT